MRAIKFRAWHKIEKRMFKVYHLSWWFGIFLIGDEHAENGRRFGSGEVELMQFTGLLDKNGKEIYEGDVVQWYGLYGMGNSYTRVVQWDNEEAMFLPNHMKDGVEIIGSIYENPELMEAKG
jgi:hypothetical protein